MMISPSVALLCSTSSCSLTASTFKVQMYGDRIQHFPCVKIQNQIRNAFKFQNTDLLGQAAADRRGTKVLVVYRSFVSRSKYLLQPQFGRNSYRRRGSSISSSCIASQIASSAFTYGTAAVLPFYTLMLLAPNSALTKKSMESTMPYVVLGILYAYLLYISWTPETLKTIFATKYLLPELPGMLRMFSNEMTMASAWIHLLAIDLFAARQVFQDGLKNNIETRHSVSLCLLFCPIGILTHVVTKILTKKQHRHSNTIDARSSKCTKHM